MGDFLRALRFSSHRYSSHRLKGNTAIMTGIGRAAAIMFAREGCSGITITYLPKEEKDAPDAKSSLEQAGSKVNLIPGDLMDVRHCQAVIDGHIKVFGKLDVLVNNASKQMYVSVFEFVVKPRRYFSRKAFVRSLRLISGSIESTFRSDILQIFAITKSALPHLKRGPSSIINTASVTAYRGSAGLSVYSAVNP